MTDGTPVCSSCFAGRVPEVAENAFAPGPRPTDFVSPDWKGVNYAQRIVMESGLSGTDNAVKKYNATVSKLSEVDRQVTRDDGTIAGRIDVLRPPG
jgi:hypothetical protein